VLYNPYVKEKDGPAPELSVSQLRDQLADRIAAAHHHGEPTVITHYGKPQAVLIPHGTWRRHLDQRPTEPSEED
jgi:prevent-host-death family protein